MSTQYRFVNNNPFPIYLPCSRGGSVLFQEGDGTTDPWFGRFIGLNQLTRVEIPKSGPKTPFVLPPNTKPAVEQRTAVAPPVIHKPSPAKLFPDKETKEYTLKNGVYTCKLCDGLFSTGSTELMTAHLGAYHAKPTTMTQQAPDIKLGQGEHEGETIVGTLTQQNTPIPEEVKRTSRPLPPVSDPKPASAPIVPALAPVISPPVNESAAPKQVGEGEQKAIFKCQFPGCEKVFVSQRGLNMHSVRVHGEKKE